MGLTSEGIWYPDDDDQVSPLETAFATQASSINAAFQAKLTPVAINAESEIAPLRRGTVFFMSPWNLTGVKTADAGTPGYRLHYSNTIVGTYNNNGYSGGSVIPGAADILITAPSITYSIPYKIRCEVSMMLKVEGACAGNAKILSMNGFERQIRWHSYNNSGLYPVIGSLEIGAPAGQSQFLVVINSDPTSGAPTTVLAISTALTVSI